MTARNQVLLERMSGAGMLDDIQDALDRAWAGEGNGPHNGKHNRQPKGR